MFNYTKLLISNNKIFSIKWIQNCNIFKSSHQLKNHEVELTEKRYPSLKRGKFNHIEENHIKLFENILDKNRVITSNEDLISYNVDWLKTVRGSSKLVLKPKTTEEVSEILKICYKDNLAICPQGGNTGLVGGSVPVFDEIVLSLSLMRQIMELDELSGVLVCQAGCILEELDNYLLNHNLMMPLDLGAKGSCQIGGNVATNAGGLRLMRYGSLHNNILGVEVVKSDGTVINCINRNKKDNTGYGLHHLFIGSEGTLGIITQVAVFCPPKPRNVSLAFLGLESFDKVIKTSILAKVMLGEVISSLEMLDEECSDAVTENMRYKLPINSAPFYMLIETSGSNSTHDEDKLNTFLDTTMTTGLVQDGTVATEPSRIKTMWQYRECIAEALLRDGYVYKYDVSLPLKKFYGLVPHLQEKVMKLGAVRCCAFGHLGDGNVHFNVTSKQFSRELLDAIEPALYEYTAKYSGSISAEHGIGLKKRKFLHFSKSSQAIESMKEIKQIFDPKGILNPYKVLP